MKKVKVCIIILLILNIGIFAYLLIKEPVRQVKTMKEYTELHDEFENLEEVIGNYKGAKMIGNFKSVMKEYLSKNNISYKTIKVISGTANNQESSEYLTFQVEVTRNDGKKLYYKVNFYNGAMTEQNVVIQPVKGGSEVE